MKRAISILLIAVSVLLCLCSCGEKEVQSGESGYSFTDDSGRTVTVNSHERVATLLGSYADIWMLAGGAVCASADDAWEDLNLSMPEDAVNLGKSHSPSKDELLAANPDLVLASSKLSGHLEMRETLENAGITVAYFDVSDFEGFLHMLKICTDITGKPELYEKYGTAQKAEIDAILERSKAQPAQKVLVMKVSASTIKAKNTSGTMLGGMLKDFGCINIADSDSSLLENLSIESIIQQNPEKIFFVQMGDNVDGTKKNVEKLFSENPLWNELDAVKNGKVYYMEKELYNMKPNARFAEAYEKLEKILYEE